MDDIKAIDIMNYPIQCREIIDYDFNAWPEWLQMARTTFRTWFPQGRFPRTPEEYKDFSHQYGTIGYPYETVADMVKAMDEIGYEKICMCACKLWSYRGFGLIWDFTVDQVQQIIEKANGRIIGAAGYNPFKIEESLKEIEKAAKEYNFKFVYIHPLGFGFPPNDKKFYPLYAKCNELNIPVSMQVGHSAEPLPSWVGNPMYIDEVVMDFPNLRINLSHTGWPWIREWCDMIWKHPNVYGDIAAYLPKSLDRYQLDFIISGKGRDKVMWGTNGTGLKLGKSQILEMEIKEEVKRKILRDNAMKFLALDD